jgi:hypothetical protein
MLSFKVEFDKSQYEALIKKLELLANDKEINNAIKKAARKAASEARKETLVLIPAAYTIPSSEVKSAIKVRASRGSEPGATMRITSGVFSLYEFGGVTPKEIMPPAKGPVRVAVKQDGDSELGRAFIAKMPSGHIGVFEREGVKRLSKTTRKDKENKIHDHIQELFGPSVPGMFGREKETPVNTAVIKRAGEIFNELAIVELEGLLNG